MHSNKTKNNSRDFIQQEMRRVCQFELQFDTTMEKEKEKEFTLDNVITKFSIVNQNP